MSQPSESAAGLDGDFGNRWQQRRIDWGVHAAMALMTLVLISSRQAALIGWVLAWLAAYLAAFIGYRVHKHSWVGRGYVAAAVIISLGIFITADWSLQFFLVFPTLWIYSARVREALGWTLVLGSIIGATSYRFTLVSGGGQTEALMALLLFGGGPVVFTIFLAFWFMQVEKQSERMRELAVELLATRNVLAASEHARGVQEERDRLSREIHDTLAQGFTSIAMLTQAARVPNADLAARLDQIESAARDGLTASRQLIAESQPAFDLPASLARLTNQFTARTGVSVELQAADWTGAGVRTDVVALRCVQEALHNVEKHAQATHVLVVAELNGHAARIVVADDGHGFDADGPTGFGLASMRRRVGDEGGTVEVRSGSGGTTLTVEIPISEEMPAELEEQ